MGLKFNPVSANHHSEFSLFSAPTAQPAFSGKLTFSAATTSVSHSAATLPQLHHPANSQPIGTQIEFLSRPTIQCLWSEINQVKYTLLEIFPEFHQQSSHSLLYFPFLFFIVDFSVKLLVY